MPRYGQFTTPLQGTPAGKHVRHPDFLSGFTMKPTTTESIRLKLAPFLAPNRWIAIAAAIAAIFAVVDIAPRIDATLYSSGKLDEIKLLGVAIVIIVAIRSIVREVMEILIPEKRISCGSGIASTEYDFRALLARDPTEVFVVAQNMRTILSSPGNLSAMTKWLSRNPTDVERRLTIVLATPSSLTGTNLLARQHLRQTVTELRELQKNALHPEQLLICFHPGAAMLSVIACEKDDPKEGLLVFTPKFGIDAQPGNRLYCVIYRSEHPDLFGVLAGSITMMTQNDSLSLEDVCGELDV